jgi:hypothetical protein
MGEWVDEWVNGRVFKNDEEMLLMLIFLLLFSSFFFLFFCPFLRIVFLSVLPPAA